MDLSKMSPQRPFLLRAFYDWLLDNQLTPHLVVDIYCPGVQVPMEYARDGQIVFNIVPHAVANLVLGNDVICFNARMGGVPHYISFPVAAVTAIYARENGAGTLFEPEQAYEQDPASLAVVDTQEPRDQQQEGGQQENAAELTQDTPSTPPRGRPTLRVIK